MPVNIITYNKQSSRHKFYGVWCATGRGSGIVTSKIFSPGVIRMYGLSAYASGQATLYRSESNRFNSFQPMHFASRDPFQLFWAAAE